MTKINEINNRIKRKSALSLNNFLYKSFYGLSLDEIANWYPKMINKNDIFDYLVQKREYDSIAMIAAYEKYHTNNFNEDSIDCNVGFQIYCKALQDMALRVCYSMCESIDNNLYDSERKYLNNLSRNKGNITDYKEDEYIDFINGDEAGKRFITKYEFEKFLKQPKELRTNNLDDYDYSIESLFIMLFQHKKEYKLNEEKIITQIIPRGSHRWSHEGIANEYLKYNNYLSEEYNNKNSLTFDKYMITDHFFDPIEIID